MISFTSARGAAVIAVSAMPDASNRPILRIWQSSPLALLVVSVHRPARAVNLGACRSAHRPNRFSLEMPKTEAADLKFLQRLPQTRIGPANRKAAVEL